MAYNGLSQHVKFEDLPAPDDRFVLQDLIGEGTYGEVYSARDTVTGKPLLRTSHVCTSVFQLDTTENSQFFQ